jgi:multidrug efflux system membrane fusion protein
VYVQSGDNNPVKRTYVVAIAFAVGVAVWMLSGLLGHRMSAKDQDAASAEKTTRSTVAQVRVRHMTAQPERLEVVLRGHTEAKHVVLIKAEIGGRVVEVPVEKGQRVKQGDVLCHLSEDDHKAQLAQVQAMLDKATIDYDGALKLREKNLLSSTSIAAAKAGLENAKANLKSAQLAVEWLIMRAPFAAYVEDRPAQLGDLMERGGVCARLVDESSLLVTAQASEREVTSLVVGVPVTAQLADGGVVNGHISFIGRIADPMTRTYRVEAAIDTQQHSVRDGITAQLTIPLQEMMTYHMTPAVLALDDAGQVGVRLVNAENKVEFHHVQVVRENASGIWVAGLAPEIDLITVGQEFVAEGDTVQTEPDTSVLPATDVGKKSAATRPTDAAPL